ncbi:hypothetical protein ACLKA7_001518 [Drosophila subpalustris]
MLVHHTTHKKTAIATKPKSDIHTYTNRNSHSRCFCLCRGAVDFVVAVRYKQRAQLTPKICWRVCLSQSKQWANS